MPEIRDPAIKLFGRTIALLPADGGGGGGDGGEDKGHPTEKTTTASEYREEENPESEENSEHISSPADDNHKHSSDDQETAPEEEEEEDQEQTDSSNPLLKKPDKILPCPRCNSLETKFCYYNNYNVNQPRHFCKNCQRYWTAGGAMRNVPVGAGRRKNKNPVAPLYHHLTLSDEVNLQAVTEPIHHPPLKSGGSVLSFGSDAPVPEKTTNSCHRNGLHRAEEQPGLSSVTPSNCDGTGSIVNEPSIRNCQSFTPQIPWPFPWNPPPPVCVSSYPMPFHPAAAAAAAAVAAAAAYWGCTPWSLPWLTSPTPPPPLSGSSVSVPDPPALGKHSREEDGALPAESSSGRHHRLWIPKTLRIHDPEEAAKSSIWATMGFESDKSTTEGCRGFFKAFQTKGEPSRTHLGEASQALLANPAALSRSMSFLESSQVTDFSSIDAL